MAERTSPGRQSPSQSKPDLELFFALPAEHYQGITAEAWKTEMEQMFQHSVRTRQFLEGKLSPQDYEDSLSDLGHAPHALSEFWENGNSFGF